ESLFARVVICRSVVVGVVNCRSRSHWLYKLPVLEIASFWCYYYLSNA
ncbi:11313_t:CDS:1, partial [Gigaspora rosea]